MNMILYHTYKVLFSSSKNLSSKHLFLFILLTKNLIFMFDSVFRKSAEFVAHF